MRSVALVKLWDSYDSDDYHSGLQSMITDWVEVTDEEFFSIQDSVRWANRHNREYVFALVEKDDGSFKDEVFKDAKAFHEKIQRQKEAEEKKKEKAKLNKEAKALERKKKQLAKLKEELGDK